MSPNLVDVVKMKWLRMDDNFVLVAGLAWDDNFVLVAGQFSASALKEHDFSKHGLVQGMGH